ncbi:PREDICTED: transmembrane protein 126A-like [Branchiostoma belcheri]|uniref:Transmembrane protein 126A-like n=1 Tax=Branchiostoma belcheri TaxID=7741 RepID=A0A6P4YSX3_BRABE|nr:PREDICTED: transmembrane protein 126A-like [Branchiostoma belcheri]
MAEEVAPGDKALVAPGNTGVVRTVELTEAELIRLQYQALQQIPKEKRWPFTSGVTTVGVNAGFVGLIANSMFRRVLDVTQARLLSALPMFLIPAVTATGAWQAFVAQSMLAGNLNCPVCAQVRGASINVLAGFVNPVCLAIPMAGGLAKRYYTAVLPKGSIRDFWEFWVRTSRPILWRMLPALALQAAWGAALASKEFDLYLRISKHGFVVLGDRETVAVSGSKES